MEDEVAEEDWEWIDDGQKCWEGGNCGEGGLDITGVYQNFFCGIVEDGEWYQQPDNFSTPYSGYWNDQICEKASRVFTAFPKTDIEDITCLKLSRILRCEWPEL